MKNLITLLLLSLILSTAACSHKDNLTGGGSDKDYCAEKPTNCAYHATEVQP